MNSKEFDAWAKEYAQSFVDEADNEDLEAFLDQDFEESCCIEDDILKEDGQEYTAKQIEKLVTVMKRMSRKVLKAHSED